MKKSFVTLLILLLLVVAERNLFAQIPASDSRYLQLTREYTLNPDGSTVYRFIKEQELLTYRSFHNLYGETFVVYDPSWQKLNINTSYTIMADGKKIDTPANAFNEVLPSFAANAPAWNGLREMVITHTGLERNARIHLDYEIHSRPPVVTGISGSEILAEPDPADKITVKIRVPSGTTLFHSSLNGAKQPVLTREGAFDVYTWEVQDAGVVTPEEYQTTGWRGYPRIIFSTLQPHEVIREIGLQPAIGAEITPAMKEAVDSFITAGNPLITALKIREMVVNDFRYYQIPFRYTAGKCRIPSEVWQSSGGTALEKSVLLAALLRSAGTEATPVVISDTPFEISDFAVMISPEKHPRIILSATHKNDQDMVKANGGRMFYPFSHDKVLAPYKPDPPAGKLNLKGTFIISSDPGLTGMMEIRTVGALNPYLMLIQDSSRLRQWIAGGISVSDIKEPKEIKTGHHESFQSWVVEQKKPFRSDSNLFFFQIPFIREGVDGWGIRNLSARRVSPVEIPLTAEEEYAFEITLPAGYHLFGEEKKRGIRNGAGSFDLLIREKNGKIQIEKRITVYQGSYGPGIEGKEYNELKELMDAWNNPRHREIILIRP